MTQVRLLCRLLVLSTLAPVATGAQIRTGVGTAQPDPVRAVAGARADDTVVIADGTYNQTFDVNVSGSGPDRMITVKAENPGKAVFSRKGMAARVEGSFIRIQGLVFDAQYGDATCVRATGEHLQFVACEIRRAGTVDGKSWGDGLQLYDSAHCVIERCHIHHCLASPGGQRQDSHGVRITHSHDVTIRGCTIELVSGDCVQADPDRKAWDDVLIEGSTLSGGPCPADDPFAHPHFAAGAYTAENAVDTKCPRDAGAPRPKITIRDCVLRGFRGIDNAAAFNVKETCDAVIDRCTVHDSQIGLRLRAPARVKVTNGVLYDNDTHCRYEDGIPRLYVYHCTFGAFTGKGRGFFQEVGPSPDLRVRNCLFLGTAPPQAADASNRAADAVAFQDAAAHDYRLNAAMPVSAPGDTPEDEELKVDRAGTPRGDRPDTGAYQFGAAPP
jgi:hypothetical protein